MPHPQPPPKLPTIAVINATTVVGNAELESIAAALQIHISRDFAPIWHQDAKVVFIPKGKRPPALAWWLVNLDTSDEAGALGYHELTSRGLPIGKVFAKSDIEAGDSLSVTNGHEAGEMLADPKINRVVTLTPGLNNAHLTMVAVEPYDPCEADQYAYQIDGVLMPDFVFPDWYDQPHHAGSPPDDGNAQYDFCKSIVRPMQLLSDGYCSINNGHGWTQLYGPNTEISQRYRGRLGSRRERRPLPRTHWKRSTVVPEE